MPSFLGQIEKMKLPKAPTRRVPESVSAVAESLGLVVIITSPSAPEQYELVRNGEASGYVRVRHGGMSVAYPAAGDELLYEGPVNGLGGFEDDEREAKLLFAIGLIETRMFNA